MSTLFHQSGVNQAGEPFVQLFVDEKCVAQFTPIEVRELARGFIEAAEAAEQDAFLYAWSMEECGTTREGAAQLLVHFRRWREMRGKESGPKSDSREFVVTEDHKKQMAFEQWLERVGAKYGRPSPENPAYEAWLIARRKDFEELFDAAGGRLTDERKQQLFDAWLEINFPAPPRFVDSAGFFDHDAHERWRAARRKEFDALQ